MQALSEIFWTPDEFKNIYDFYERLGLELEWMDKKGINYRLPEPIGYKDTLVVDSTMELNFWPVCKKHTVLVYLEDKQLNLTNFITTIEPSDRPRTITLSVSNGKRSSMPYYMHIPAKKNKN